MNRHHLLYAVVVVLGSTLLGCQSLPQITQLNPTQLSLGEPLELKFQLEGNAPDDMAIAIRPSHAPLQVVGNHPQPISVLANQANLLGQGNQLNYLQNEQIISQLTLPATITGMHLAKNNIWLSTSDNTLYLLQLSSNQLSIQQSWSLTHAIDHLGHAFAASAQGELSLIQQNQLQHYALTVPYHAVDCLEQYCYLATEQGVKVVEFKSDGSQSPHHLFSVAGSVRDLHIDKKKLYLAGEMGLTIVDIQHPSMPRWLTSNNKFGPATELRISENYVLLRNLSGHYHLVDISTSQAIWQSSFNGPTHGPFDLSDQFASLADGNQLLQLSLMEAELPILNHSGINLGGSRRVQLRDNTLYVADWFSGLHLYQLDDLGLPQHAGNVHTPGSAKGVWLDGNYIYVGDDDHGLQVVDLDTLQVVHEVPTNGLAYTMDRVGNLLYLADHRGGFQIIDISHPEQAYTVGSHDTPNKVWSIQAYKQFALVTDDQSGVLIFDVSDPTQPKQVAQYQPGGFAEDIIIDGDIAYVAFFDDGLHILDISHPLMPKQIGYLSTPGNARGLYLEGQHLYLADWYAGLQIIDIKNPQQPHWVGGLDTQGAAWGVVVSGKMAYVMDWWGGIQSIDISNPEQPQQLHSFHAQQPLADVKIHHNFAYLAAGTGGLQVFDINNNQGPIWTTALNLSGTTQSLVIAKDTAFISHYPGGISVVDIRDPFYAKSISYLGLSKQINQLALYGKLLLGLDSEGSLHAWKVGADQLLQAINLTSEEHQLYALGESDGLPLVINQHGGIELLNPSSLHPEGTLPGNFQQVLLRNNILYAYDQQQLIIAQLHDSHIQPISRWQLNESLYDMQLHQGMLYLSSDQAVLALDVSDSFNPALRYLYPHTLQPGKIAIGNNALFTAGDYRLASAPLLPNVAQQSSPSPQLSVAPGLPLGTYQLIQRDSKGRQQSNDHYFKVTMPKGKRVNFTMEDLQKYIKEQKALPTQP